MRILCYYPRAVVGNGGVSNAVRDWAQELVASGHSVLVVYDAATGPMDRTSFHSLGLRHYGPPGARFPRGLDHLLERSDLLVLHSPFVLHNYHAALLAKREGVPTVLVPHGAYHPSSLRRRQWRKVLMRPVERAIFGPHAAVHAFFHGEVDHVTSWLGPATTTIVAPTGPPQGLGEAVLSTARVPTPGDRHPYVAWLGRYDVHHKGLDLLVDAVAMIPPESRPRVILHGRDSEDTTSDVSALVRRAGVEQWVSVNGPVDGMEKWQFLSNASAFIQPSRWESNSIALMEAMAFGLPVLVCDSSPIANLVLSERIGVACPCTVADLTDSLQEIIAPDRCYADPRDSLATSLSWRSGVLSFNEQLSNWLGTK
jgi:glycosyltransferase involved in cell wall biosynthesis